MELVVLDGNEGVGAGHNAALMRALEDPACQYVWILEHDSIPASKCLEEMAAAIDLTIGEAPPLGALMPNRARSTAEAQGTGGVRGGVIMTFNGVLLPRETVETFGPLREDFFVGLEDSEYADRLRSGGREIYEALGAVLIHQNKGMRSRGIVPSVLRTYYSVRNAAFLNIRLRRRRFARASSLVRGAGGSVRAILREDQKLARVAARLVAIFDAWTGRMGRRDYWFLSVSGEPGTDSTETSRPSSS